MISLAYVEMSGFRGYSRAVRIEFAKSFTIIDGRNGVGKSSIFDAIEFALLGTLTKYEHATADRESAEDYIWWRGEGVPPQNRYVEVGFIDGDDVRVIRRSMTERPSGGDIAELKEALVIQGSAPSESLNQLLKNSIIRDEHIAALSLDLKEAQRYQVLCDAIGALGSDEWVDKAARLVSEAQRRMRLAESETQTAIASINTVSSRLAQLDAAIMPTERIREASNALRQALGQTLPEAELIDAARTRVGQLRQRIDQLRSVSPAVARIREEQEALNAAAAAVETLAQQLQAETDRLQASEASILERAKNQSADRIANELAELLTLGRTIGLQDEACPLCSAPHTNTSFENGLAQAEARLGRLQEVALEYARQEREHRDLSSKVGALRRSFEDAQLAYATRLERLAALSDTLTSLDLPRDASSDIVGERLGSLEEQVSHLSQHLTTLQSLSYGSARAQAVQDASDARARHVRAEERLGVARKAEARAKALHDAARRAAGDTLDSRLNQILPLTSELYQRLRPHPIWDDISYKLRGDVKRFLKLEVGDEVNPQFVFSSGQRRATGLAFLLSVYLSISWSKFGSLMLDDPVQHIDDFRSVHLAEVLSKIVSSGRQIICAAEDAALADLLARHLPVHTIGEGKRLTLGVAEDGRLSVVDQRTVAPMPQGAFIPLSLKSAG